MNEIERAMASLTHALRELHRSHERLTAQLTRIRAERDAAVDAGIQLCVHGQPQEHAADEWRAAARVISGMHGR